MKVAAVQMQMSYSVEENTQNILHYVNEAASKGADLVTFPELSVTGCHREIRTCCDYIHSRPSWINEIQTESKRHGVYVGFGVPTFSDLGVFDSYLLISPEGVTVGESRKIGLTESESTFFTPGETRSVWTIEDLSFGIVFCREIADLTELRADYGDSVDVLLWPCFSSVHESLPTETEQMCYEQAELVAGELSAHIIQSNWANSLNSPEITNTGGSLFVASDGKRVASAPQGVAGFGVADIKIPSYVWYGLGGV